MSRNLSLISIQPIGMGTPECESLFSFLLRLAQANKITFSELIRYVGTKAGFKTNTRGVIDGSIVRKINLGNKLVLNFIEVLEELTGLRNLSFLTVARWRPLFANGLLHEKRWFYPKSERIYEPLLYAVSPVFWTPEGMPLEQYCHACGESVVNAQHGYKIGFCHKCGAELKAYHTLAAGKNDKYTSAYQNFNDLEYSVWVARVVGEMIAYSGDTSKFNFSDGFKKHLDYFGISSAADASKLLKVSHISIESWISGQSVPRFDQFLNVCYCMRVSPVEFFSQELMRVGTITQLRDSPKKTRTAIATSKRRPVDRLAMEDQLLNDIASRAFIHMHFREYCEKRFNRRDSIVRQYFPKLAREFVAQNQKFSAYAKRTTQAGRNAEVIEAARICIAEKLNVNHKNLRFFLRQPGMLMSQWARDLVKLIKIHGPDNLPQEAFENENG